MSAQVIPAADPPPLNIWAPITGTQQLPDGTLLVHAVITDETPDSEGEIVDYDAAKAALPDFMRWATLREMHQDDTAAGTVLAVQADDAARRIEGDIHVVDPVAVKKVLARVYKGVSIGGLKWVGPWMRKADGAVRRVTRLVIHELSLADRPANPDALLAKQARQVFVLAKRQEAPVADEPTTESPVVVHGTDPLSMADVAEQPEPLEKRQMDVIGGKRVDRDKLPAAVFAGPNRSFPVTNQASFDDAVHALGRAKGGPAARARIKARLIAIAREKGYTLPEAWQAEKTAGGGSSAAGGSTEAAAPFPGAAKPFKSKKAAKLAKKNKALKAGQKALEAVQEATAEEQAEQAKGSDESDDLENLADAADALGEFTAAEAAEGDDDMETAKLAKRLTKAQRRAKRLAKRYRALRKAAPLSKRLTKRIVKTLRKAILAGGHAPIDGGERETSSGNGGERGSASLEAPPVETLAKTAAPHAIDFEDLLAEALGKLPSRDDIRSMEARIGERLAKVEGAPAGGGPRYFVADRDGRYSLVSDTPETMRKADVLALAAEAADDPRLKADIGRAAAVELTKEIRRGG